MWSVEIHVKHTSTCVLRANNIVTAHSYSNDSLHSNSEVL